MRALSSNAHVLSILRCHTSGVMGLAKAAAALCGVVIFGAVGMYVVDPLTEIDAPPSVGDPVEIKPDSSADTPPSAGDPVENKADSSADPSVRGPTPGKVSEPQPPESQPRADDGASADSAAEPAHERDESENGVPDVFPEPQPIDDDGDGDDEGGSDNPDSPDDDGQDDDEQDDDEPDDDGQGDDGPEDD